ncbi:hypothetical protein JIN84_05765 [Luteolibacter yonseiensis]|uniref:RHS repeat-associated core domain-containing protein n=1 Tax=Luteolibacter yonseiensis TaxID=1144680 RepID=A0A934V9G3_9BACT|nr:RHS repeat-associated core domain-containing protein [Luteolibacter yonseiensis]MBK1815108.1 hypothetical protein [Luteolibacter yonseiensis]
MNYQLKNSIRNLPVVAPEENGSGKTYQVASNYDSYGRLVWEKSPRGFITNYVYDVATGAVVRKIEDALVTPLSGAPEGWVTPPGGGLHLVTDYDIDRYGRVIRELGPVHNVQLAPTDAFTTAVRQVAYTLYLDAAQEVRRANGHATGSAGSYTFKTVGAVTITRTKLVEGGTVEERIEATRECDVGMLTAGEDFDDRCRWSKWSFETTDQWGKVSEGRVYHVIPATGSGTVGTHYEKVEYGYDAMKRLVRVKDETGTITRTVYDARGLVTATWVGTDDTGATDAMPRPVVTPATANNMVLVAENVYDNGAAGGDGLLTKIVRKAGDDPEDDREELRAYDSLGNLTEVRTSDGDMDLLAVYGYDSLGRVREVVRYRDSVGAGNFLGKEVNHHDSEGRIYRHEVWGAEDGVLTAAPLVSNRWFDASGNLIKETGPSSNAAVKYVYDGVERNLARYVVIEGDHPVTSGGSGSSSLGGELSSSSASGSNEWGFSSDSDSDKASSSSSSSGSPSSSSSSSSSSGGSPSSSGSGSESSGSESSGSESSGSGDSSGDGSGSGGSDDGSDDGSGSGDSSGSETDPMASCPDCDEDSGVGESGAGVGTDDGSGAPSCPMEQSEGPVRYATGELLHKAVDLSWKGFGFKWGHTRSYSNRMGRDGDGLNGYRWLLKELSHVAQNQGPDRNLMAVVTGANSTTWIEPRTDGSLRSLFGHRSQMIAEGTGLKLHLPDGSLKKFYGNTPAVAKKLRGRMKSLVNRNGNEMTLTYYSDGRLDKAQWAGEGRTGVFNYDYFTSDVGRNGRICAITQTIDGVNLQRVRYDYYQVESGGSPGDLKIALVEQWNTETGTWVEIRRNYYRYYVAGEANGFAHGLKMIIGPAGCRRMMTGGVSFVTTTDEELLGFSDFYFEYDGARRVKHEKINGGSMPYSFEYWKNPTEPSLSQVNTWATRTTETRPDGSKNIVYSNAGGKAILSILRAVGGASWHTYREYNSDYQTTLDARSSAIAGVTEPVIGGSSTLTVTLSDTGRVKIYDYNEETDPVAPRYLKSVSEQPGGNSSLREMLKSHSYGKHGDVAGGFKGVVTKTATETKVGGKTLRETKDYQFHDGAAIVTPPGAGGTYYPPNYISDDYVHLQETRTYDKGGNIILTSRSERYHDETARGPLYGANPGPGLAKGRRTYTAYWPDAIGRVRATAEYGTNSGADLTRPGVPPATSDSVLVTTRRFAGNGEANAIVDTLGRVTSWKSDARGRRTELVENEVDGGTATDQNRTTNYEYHSNSQLRKLIVKNAVTGDQETEWCYGVTPAGGSAIAHNGLVRRKKMADGGSYTNQYNRQGQAIRYTDPNGTVHEYEYDKLGRLVHDSVTAFGTGIDDLVTGISRGYSDQGQLAVVSSHRVGGTVNQVRFEYNAWGQLAADRQSVIGSVISTTPSVTYGYRDGTGNDIRPVSITHPSGRKINYRYGTAGGLNEQLGRIGSLRVEGATVDLVSYQYVGLDRFIRTSYVEGGMELNYNFTGGNSGDPYGGWDRHGRTREMRWMKGSTQIDRHAYTYDRAGQRLTQTNSPGGTNESQAFVYDGLRQLKNRIRGGTIRMEEFSYDPIGNWTGYDVWEDGVQTLDQSRVHNASNMLTQIDGSSALLAHDATGNLTQCPPDVGGSWSDSHQLKWDAWNRLAEVRDGSGDLIAAYEYDGLMRRTKAVTPDLATDTYYNHMWRPVEEHLDDGSTTTTHSYDWGLRYRDDLVRRVRKEGSGTPVVHYALHDYYNVTAITSSTGTVLERYRYSGFGEVGFLTAAYADKSASDYQWNILHKAQMRDEGTGWYNYGYRYYSPLLGRFINRDPIWEEGGTNVYAFVLNNGINGTDLYGLTPDMDTRGRIDRSWDELMKDYSDRGLEMTEKQKKALMRGCIGLALCKLNRTNGFPEEDVNTTCYQTEKETDGTKCGPGQRKVVFAKQGKYTEPDGPKKWPDGAIPKNSVEASDGKAGYNYVTRYPTKDGFRYGWGDHAWIYGDQNFTFHDVPANDRRYPDSMWCAACVPCKGGDGSEK